MFRIPSMTLTVLLLVVGLAADATPHVCGAGAKRQRAEIQSFVERLLPREEDTPGAKDAAAVILYKQSYFDVKPGSYQLCRNLVFRVKNTGALGEDLLAPYTDVEGKVITAEAFKVRGKNFVRSTDKDNEILPGDGMIRRTRVRFPMPDVQDGDVVGWSIITEFEGPLYVARVAAADRYPVAYSSLSVRADRKAGSGSQGYEIRGQGMASPLEVDIDAYALSRPSAWKTNITNLAAVPDLPGTPPYPPDVPVFLVVHSETYVNLPNVSEGWASSTGWTRTALFLSRFKEDRLKSNSPHLEEITRSVVADAASDVDKETAIFEYVRDKFGRVEGDAYDNRGFRRSVDAALEAGSLTDFEKVFLMILMLKDAGLSGEICAVHEEPYGPIDDTLRSYHQFQALAVRCGDEEPRFYAPAVPTASPGRLPEAWGTCTVLSPTPGLIQKAQDFTVVLSQRFQADEPGQSTPGKIKNEVEEYVEQQGWYRLETAP
jgi:hypothetical protein